jgi:hypothetical protein
MFDVGLRVAYFGGPGDGSFGGHLWPFVTTHPIWWPTFFAP